MLDSDFKDGGIFGNSFWNEKPGDPGASAGVNNAAPNPDQDFLDWLQSKTPNGQFVVYQGNQYGGTGGNVESTSSVTESEPVTLENTANESSGTSDTSETKEGQTLAKTETENNSSDDTDTATDNFEWVTHLNEDSDDDIKTEVRTAAENANGNELAFSDFSITDDNFDVGKKIKNAEDFQGLEKDERPLGEIVKGTAGEMWSGIKGFGNYLLENGGNLGTDLLNGWNNMLDNAVKPDVDTVDVNGKTYKYNANDPTQYETLETLSALSKNFTEVDNVDEAIQMANAILAMNNAIATNKSWSATSLVSAQTLRGSNQSTMQKASESLLSQMDNYFTPEVISQMSPEQRGLLAKSIIINNTFANFDSKAVANLMTKLDKQEGVKSAIQEIEPVYREAQAQAKDKKNAGFIKDTIDNAMYVSLIYGQSVKGVNKLAENLSKKYGMTGEGANALDTSIQKMLNAQQKVAAFEAEHSEAALNLTKMFDPKTYDSLMKEYKALQKQAVKAQREFALKSTVGSVADELHYSPKMAEGLSEAAKEATAAGDVNAAKVFGKSAALGHTINAATIAAEALTGASNTNNNKTTPGIATVGAVGALAKEAGKAAVENIDSKQADNPLVESATEAQNTLTDIENSKKEPEPEIKSVYLKDIEDKVDAIDTKGDALTIDKELSNQMKDLTTIGKSTFESMVRDFLSEGGKLQDIRENENLKQFSSDVYRIAQKIYDKTSAIEERTDSYGLGNLDEKSIKQNLDTITDKINALTERMPTYYSPGSDMGGIGSSGVTLDKNQVKALADYTESVQCTKDAAIALMKSAAFNGAANVTGDKYSEAWKNEMAVKTIDNTKTMTKEEFKDKNTLKWTDYLAAGAKGTLGTMVALLGGAVTTINPALGIILMGAGSSTVGKAGLNIATKVSRSKSTNEEVMFGTNESDAVNVMNDVYNRSLEPANFGDVKSVGTYTNGMGGALEIISGVMSFIENPAAAIAAIKDGVDSMKSATSGGLAENTDTAIRNVYELGENIITWSNMNININDYMSTPNPNLISKGRDENTYSPTNSTTVNPNYATYGKATSDNNSALDNKYSGFTEQAKNANLAKDYNAGMEQETNEAVSSKDVKKFIVRTYKSEPDYIRNALNKIITTLKNETVF